MSSHSYYSGSGKNMQERRSVQPPRSSMWSSEDSEEERLAYGGKTDAKFYSSPTAKAWSIEGTDSEYYSEWSSLQRDAYRKTFCSHRGDKCIFNSSSFKTKGDDILCTQEVVTEDEDGCRYVHVRNVRLTKNGPVYGDNFDKRKSSCLLL